MNDTWKSVLGVITKLAPTVASAFGTPLAGAAVLALESAFGLTTEGTTEDKQNQLAAVISGATPEQLLAMKKCDNDFAIQMKELGFKNITDLEALATGDRDSARKREMTVRDNTPKILAYTLTTGFFLVLGFMMFSEVPPGSRDLLNILLGMLATSFSGVIAYYFGSSSGSAEKTKLLAASTPPK